MDLWEHFGRTDQIALITCRKKLNVSGAFLNGEQKPIKKNHIKEFGGGNGRERPGDKFGTSQGTPGTFGPIYVEIHIQGAECPRDRRDRWRDRWDMSTGQTGHKTKGCPAKILYVCWFFFFPQNSRI